MDKNQTCANKFLPMLTNQKRNHECAYLALLDNLLANALDTPEGVSLDDLREYRRTRDAIHRHHEKIALE